MTLRTAKGATLNRGFDLVADFGATGDGTTDDTVAFIAANLGAAGEAVYCPPGTYLLDSILTANAQTPALTQDLILWADDPNTCIIQGKSDKTQAIRIKTAGKVSLKNITFKTFLQVLATPAEASQGDYKVNKLHISNCVFTNILATAISLPLNGDIKDVMITDNVFEEIANTAAGNTSAIQIGSEALGSQSVQEPYVITGNVFRNITSNQNGADVHGVFLWGENAIVSGNYFNNIHNADYTSGSEAIYTKTKFSTISNNTIVDGGFEEGAITLKGTFKTGSSTINGFGNNIIGNNIYWEEATSTDRRGIYVRSDDLFISGNTIDGADKAIYSTQEAQANSNVVIQNNVIRNLRGVAGIDIANIAHTVIIRGNTLESLVYTGSSTVKMISISGTAASKTFEISNNTITVDALATCTGEVRCLEIGSTAALDQAIIRDNNIIFTNTTSNPVGINLTGISNLSNVIVVDNEIPILGSLNPNASYNKWLNITTLPPIYKFHNNGPALAGSNVIGEKVKLHKTFRYNFTQDPNGTVNIGEVPTGAVITNAWYHVTSGFTSASSTATCAMGITTDDAAGIKAATLVNDADLALNAIVQCIPNTAVANYTTAATAIRALRFVIAVQDLTAGALDLHVEYVII